MFIERWSEYNQMFFDEDRSVCGFYAKKVFYAYITS